MAGASSTNDSIIRGLKAVTGEEKPDGYLKALYCQQIVDYRQYIENSGSLVEFVRARVDRYKVLIVEMDAAGHGASMGYARLKQDLEDAETMLVDLEHWVKKAHMGIQEKRRLLGEDW